MLCKSESPIHREIFWWYDRKTLNQRNELMFEIERDNWLSGQML